MSDRKYGIARVHKLRRYREHVSRGSWRQANDGIRLRFIHDGDTVLLPEAPPKKKELSPTRVRDKYLIKQIVEIAHYRLRDLRTKFECLKEDHQAELRLFKQRTASALALTASTYHDEIREASAIERKTLKLRHQRELANVQRQRQSAIAIYERLHRLLHT